MFIKSISFLLIATLLFLSVPAVRSADVAELKHSLPDFRGISSWNGLVGLTMFSPDGKHLAMSGKGGDVLLYDTETGKLLYTIEPADFQGFSFTPDGKFILGQMRADLSVFVYDLATGKPVRQIRGLGKLAAINKGYSPGLLNMVNGVPLMGQEMGPVPMLDDWKTVLMNRNDKEFTLVDFQSGDKVFEIEHEKYSAGWEATKLALVLLATVAGAPSATLLLGSTSAPRVSPGGKFLLIANGNKFPTLWDLQARKLVKAIDTGDKVFWSNFSPDDSMIATSDSKGITKIWSTASGDLITTIGSKSSQGLAAGWTDDSSKILVMPVRKGELKAHRVKDASVSHTFPGSQAGGFLFNNSGSRLLAIPTKNKKVLFQIWDTETGRLLSTAPRIKGQNGLISAKWSPDDSKIVTASGIKKVIQLWNSRGEHLQDLRNSTMPMQFSPDGRFLATGGEEGPKKEDTGYIWSLPARRD